MEPLVATRRMGGNLMLDKSLGLDLTKLIDRFLHQALVSLSFYYEKN
jgi:hypothetical protein